jgi:23S rRNA U2552 (ribose-2'-O)-methylase RlmE/FtsJ
MGFRHEVKEQLQKIQERVNELAADVIRLLDEAEAIHTKKYSAKKTFSKLDLNHIDHFAQVQIAKRHSRRPQSCEAYIFTTLKELNQKRSGD